MSGSSWSTRTQRRGRETVNEDDEDDDDQPPPLPPSPPPRATTMTHLKPREHELRLQYHPLGRHQFTVHAQRHRYDTREQEPRARRHRPVPRRGLLQKSRCTRRRRTSLRWLRGCCCRADHLVLFSVCTRRKSGDREIPVVGTNDTHRTIKTLG